MKQSGPSCLPLASLHLAAWCPDGRSVLLHVSCMSGSAALSQFNSPLANALAFMHPAACATLACPDTFLPLHLARRALDLVYALVNEGNIQSLTAELLEYLAVADAEFKPDLTAKIAALVQRFAPNKRWHFDSLLQVPLLI